MVRWLTRCGVMFGVSFVVLVAPGIVSGQSLNDARAAYKRGVQLYEADRYQEAKIAGESALRLFERFDGRDSLGVGDALNLLGNVQTGLGQYTKAEALYLRSLQIRESTGRNNRFVGDTLLNLGLLYRDMGEYAKAAPRLARSLQILQQQPGVNQLDVASRQSGLAGVYSHMGQYDKAEPLYRRCLETREATLGKDHSDTADALNNLALLYSEMGEYARAETLCRRSLAIYEAKFGKDDPRTVTCLSNLATVYHDMGQYAKAELLCRRCLEIREATLGKDHLDTAASLNNLAHLYSDMGQYANAEPLYRRGVEIFEGKLGKDHPNVALALSNLAALYDHMGQYTKAELLYRRCLAIREARLGKDHPDTASILNNLAVLYFTLGQYAKAEPLYRRCLEIREVKLGKEHPLTAQCLSNLAALYHNMGQYARAELLHRRCLEIREAKLGKDHPDTASSLISLANLYSDMGQYAKAEPLCLRGLEIYEARLGKDHPLSALTLNNLAHLYALMDQYARAEPLYHRSLDIREAKLGKDHPDVANSLNNLGCLHWDMGQYARAEPFFRRSLDIRAAALGKDHPLTTQSLNNLAGNAASQHEWKNAVADYQNSRRAIANHLAEVLPVLTEKEQLNLLETNFAWAFHKALSLGWSAHAEASAASAEWLLNGKAIAHQSLAEQQILARDAKDPKARQLIDDLQQTRSRLAALINRAPRPGLELEYQRQVQELRASEQDLAQKLARAIGRPYRANVWVSLDELRGKLGPKTAFVDIARFPVFDFVANKKIGLRYVAWITPPQGKEQVLVIDLGEAEAIDRLVEETRKSLLDSATSVTKIGEIEALQALQKPLQKLSAKVLHPLLPALAQYEEWIVCPDGALWLMPWNALLLPNGKFAVEKHLIRHVVSGRDLVLELPKAIAESAYIFADPDYDLSPGKVLAAAGGLRSLQAPSLLGQRLRGTITTWNVSFEFLESEVLIRDEDGGGAVAGKGTWKQQGSSLTIRTSLALFQGALEGSEIRGQRSKRNDDGSTTRDTFRMTMPHDDADEFRSAGSAVGALPKVPRLPGTAAEAAAVRPKIQRWLGQEPKVFVESQASEAMLKAVKNPRVLVLATHGYFLPTQEVQAKDRPDSEPGENKRAAALFDKKGQPIENPLLRCGLLLAGCNRRAEAKSGEDDGILTGLEIVGLNLNGCDLVVLSACETGLGDVRNGEGVAGLRQAFQLAGAKAVLASLWQVPDRETALLMNGFYGEIAKGRSQAEALRQTQLQRIASRREQFGARAPVLLGRFHAHQPRDRLRT